MGLTLGAYVLFFVFGGNAFAEGIGEGLAPLQLPPAWYVVLVPPVSVATQAIFAAPELTRNSKTIKISSFSAGFGRNDLESVVCSRHAEVAAHLEWLRQFGDARMSGSGACVFLEFAAEREARSVLSKLPAEMRGFAVRRLDSHPLAELLENVRGKDCFVLQSTCAPANDSLMEVLLMVDALKRASAARVTAAIPYFGYARQDRRPRSARVAISAKVLANMLQAAGVDRVLTMDLHADQIQGFFDVPVDNIYATPVLLGDVWKHQYENLLVVSPDVGGVVRARAMAKRLESDLAIIDKRRPQPNVSEVMNVIGDVKGRNCVLMDDMVDTANTLVKAAQALKQEGATRVVAYCTHPVLSGGAVERIAESEIDELVVTDSIPLSKAGQACKKIRVLSVAGLLAETILRISNEDSVSSLFIE